MNGESRGEVAQNLTDILQDTSVSIAQKVDNIFAGLGARIVQQSENG